jgi:hypothetical protein
LIDALPNFEFPRTPLLNNYTIDIIIKNRNEVEDDDFVTGEAISSEEDLLAHNPEEEKVYID